MSLLCLLIRNLCSEGNTEAGDVASAPRSDEEISFSCFFSPLCLGFSAL